MPPLTDDDKTPVGLDPYELLAVQAVELRDAILMRAQQLLKRTDDAEQTERAEQAERVHRTHLVGKEWPNRGTAPPPGSPGRPAPRS